MKEISACIYNIKYGDYEKAILDGLSKIKFKEIIKSDDAVLVKPNFTWPSHKKGVTTTPTILDQLTSILKNRCKNIYIGESDGGNFSWSADKCFKEHKILDIAKKNGVDLINLTKKHSIMKNVVIDGENIQLKVSKFILEKIDALITIPVLKTHVATEVSLGLKNQWGCLPDPMRLLYHPFLHKGIVAVNKIYKPKISIIDATYGLTGNGPIYGVPIRLNKILISNDITALDIIACSFMGIPFEKIKHIKIAKKEFLKDFNTDNIKKYGNFENQIKFKMYRSFFDKISVFIMYNRIINNIFYGSIFSGFIKQFLNFYKSLFKKQSAY